MSSTKVCNNDLKIIVELYKQDNRMNINSIDDIKRLTAKSEGVDIEYKETTGQLERGIGLIIDECKKVNIPEPKFETNNGFVTVTYKYRTSKSTYKFNWQ